MNRLRRNCVLAASCALASLAGTDARASSLFDGSNANLWLIDTSTGRVAGFNYGAWLDQFAPGNVPVYVLSPGEQALINLLHNSSVPMTPNQPAISIVGLEDGGDPANPGHPALQVLPPSGSYDQTIAVHMRANTDILPGSTKTLRWSIDGAPEQSIALSRAEVVRPGAPVQDGYYIKTVYLVRNGTYSVDVSLTDPSQTYGSISRSYIIATDPGEEMRDTDGDGIPDFVEAEIGLDPFTDDWQKDSDGDGWSDFDAWLRTACLDASLQTVPGSDCLDAEGKPQDTDGDGWSDFDEKVRGTRFDDPAFDAALLLEDDETLGSDSLQKRVLRYKDFPAARRLYEVERSAVGDLPDAVDEALEASRIVSLTVLGQTVYDSNELLTDEEVMDSGLGAGDIAQRRLASLATADLANRLIPAMRLPAGDSAVLSAVFPSTGPDMEYRRIYKRWLPQHADATPRVFAALPGQPVYNSADEWRDAFVQFLAARLVVAEDLQVGLEETVTVSLIEAALSGESRLRELQNTQLFSTLPGALDGDVVRKLQTDLRRFGGEEHLLDDTAAAYAAMAASGQPLQPVADWIGGNFLSGRTGTRSDAWIAALILQSYDVQCFVPAAEVPARQADADAWAAFLLQCPDWFSEAEIPALVQESIERRHAIRTAILPGAAAAIAGDASLLAPDTDSDADMLSNSAEIGVPLVDVSLPWLADSDGDGLLDGNDDCPADDLNRCSSNPLLPELTIGFDIFVSEPANGTGIAIISIVLNRASDLPVTVDYRAFIAVGDTAIGGSDFLEVTGSVTIPAGERVALITVPILADADFENPETFTVEITGISNATVGDDGQVVVTINNTEPGANTAPVFTSGTTASTTEGRIDTGYVATANDADNDVLSFSTSGGADQAAFTIDADNGDLSFVSAPVFAAPSDADADNVYEVQLQVSDNRGGLDTLDVTVTVTEAGLLIEVTFPTPGANLGGTVSQTRVAGNITDSSGTPVDAADISFVDVNGVLATMDPARPGRWTATVPVSVGDNLLAITTQSVSGQGAGLDLELQNFVIHTNFEKLVVDTANNRALVAESVARAVISVDLASGERSILSATGTGTGTAFNSPRDVAIDLANNRALVVDWQLDALIAVDLASGNRTVLSHNSTGTGIALDGPQAVAFDAAGNRAFVIASIEDNVIAVDLATGNRSIVTGAATGAGPVLASPRDLSLDSANNRLLVIDSSLDALLAIDIATGDRTIISDGETGLGPMPGSAESMAFDSAGNRVLIADISRALISVDLATGDRDVVSDFAADFGINTSNLIGVAFDAGSNRALVADSAKDTIFAVDPDTGVRSVISDSHTGDSNIAARLSVHTNGMEIDLERNRVLVLTSPSIDRLVAVDLGTGDRTVVSDSTTGTGPNLQSAQNFTIDRDNNRALIPDESAKAIFAVDLDTGDRSIVSNNASIGIGAPIAQPSDVAMDLPNNRLLLIDSTAGLLAVDLATGNRSVVSDSVTGSGPTLSQPNGIVLDESGDRAFVVDYGLQSMLAIQLATGDRTAISNNSGTGSGSNFFVPYDLALDQEANRALVADYGVRVLFAVDLDTGDRTILSGSTAGSGVTFSSPEFIALDNENKRVFVYDLAVTALMVIDLETGQRAVMSK